MSPTCSHPSRAERLHDWLARSAQRSLVLHDGQNVREATPEQRRQADEIWERQMAVYAYARARYAVTGWLVAN